MSIPKPTKKIPSTTVTEFSSKRKQIISQDDKINATKKQKFNRNKEDKNENLLTLKQAKHDVFKYGIKGFSKEEQNVANMQLAIKLGAAVSF